MEGRQTEFFYYKNKQKLELHNVHSSKLLITWHDMLSVVVATQGPNDN